jgi:hypothetical protein
MALLVPQPGQKTSSHDVPHAERHLSGGDYAGVNTLKPGRLDELAMHPTVKPVALVADAIKDCSRRNGLVSSTPLPAVAPS